MTDEEFAGLLEDTLISVEEAVEETGAAIDCHSSGKDCTLEFANGSEIYLSGDFTQRILQAEGRDGMFRFGYEPDSGLWKNIADGEELFRALARLCSSQSGKPVSFD